MMVSQIRYMDLIANCKAHMFKFRMMVFNTSDLYANKRYTFGMIGFFKCGLDPFG